MNILYAERGFRNEMKKSCSGKFKLQNGGRYSDATFYKQLDNYNTSIIFIVTLRIASGI